jgi:hypothetical protein
MRACAKMQQNVLILGASYGSLLGTKLLMAGHRVSLVCTHATADLIEREGTRVRFPLAQHGNRIEIASSTLSGVLSACTPDEADTGSYDLIVLAMQEPQLASPDVRALMGRIALSRKPCLAIMNMPPLAYLQRISGVDPESLRTCYTDASVWDDFDPQAMTLASPDAQAFRVPNGPKNVLEVGLATNFKAARFDVEAQTKLLHKLAADIDAARYGAPEEAIEIPVKLKVHDSIFVPLAKWPMLITGNYRCILPDGMISIKDAVHSDIRVSRSIYEWVCGLCIALGAASTDLVPFEKYATAASSLSKPSSAARAIAAGVEHIERVDRLVQQIAVQRGLESQTLDEIVRTVDERLERNRAGAHFAEEVEAAPQRRRNSSHSAAFTPVTSSRDLPTYSRNDSTEYRPMSRRPKAA